MSLERRGTIFGLPLIRGVTPDSHENGSIEANSLVVASGSNSNKLKRKLEEAWPKIRGHSKD